MKSTQWWVLGLITLACTPDDGGNNDAASDTSGQEAVGDGDGEGDGDDEGENACDRLIECAGEAAPELLSTYAKLYGPEGECYETAWLTKEDCWKECDALRESLAGVNPDAGACASLGCGDGKLSYGEECDGTRGCSATCQFNTENECNPVTQFECPADDSFCFIDNNTWRCTDPILEDARVQSGRGVLWEQLLHR
jgi:hypothetical protein